MAHSYVTPAPATPGDRVAVIASSSGATARARDVLGTLEPSATWTDDVIDGPAVRGSAAERSIDVSEAYRGSNFGSATSSLT
jgi:hypothetical protein